jgi:hypothetical protein
MAIYIVAEMLPCQEVVLRPNGEFSAGKGFESKLAEFVILGPYESQSSSECEDDYFKYYDEGYLVDIVHLEQDSERP